MTVKAGTLTWCRARWTSASKAPDEAVSLDEVLPLGVLRVAARLEHWVAENARSARAFLKRVDRIVPLTRPLQQLAIVELPRPPKGQSA